MLLCSKQKSRCGRLVLSLNSSLMELSMLLKPFAYGRSYLEALASLAEIPRSKRIRDAHWQGLFYILLVCLCIVSFATFLDYGVTWDEETQRLYGYRVFRWYSTLFQNRTAVTEADLYLYGGFFELILQFAIKILPFGLYETRHLINVLFGMIAIVSVYKLGTHLSNPVGGFFSALFLTLTPVFYGHLFNNPKDIPFAALFSLALYYIFLSYDSLPHLGKNLIAKLGITIGLTLGVRIGGTLLFGYLVILWTGWLISQYVANSPLIYQSRLTKISLVRSFIFTLLLAWAVMLVWWPWAQVSPLFNPLSALTAMSRFEYLLPVFFNGRYLDATRLPWTYVPTWLAISLPEFYFISLLCGCFLAYRFFLGFKKDSVHVGQVLKTGLLVFIFCFPILTAIILHSTIYNGIRHFLFILPPLSVLAGIAVAGLFKSQVSGLIKLGVGVMILLSASLTIFDMVQLHPFQSIYFNRVVAGGVASAAERFETDYWGNSYKEGAEWLINNHQSPAGQEIRVANCSNPFLTRYFFEKTEDARRKFVTVALDQQPDIILSTTREVKCLNVISEGKVLHTVQRKGTPILYIIEV